jgi:hypothetical protein
MGGRIMRKFSSTRREGRRSDRTVNSVALKVYRGLLRAPRRVKARLPYLDYLSITPLDKNTFSIILTGTRTVGKAMTRVLHREGTRDTAASIRKRIDDRAAKWREKHGTINLVRKNYSPGEHLDVLSIVDPAGMTALAFNPDRFASLMGASSTVTGRKI